MPMSVYERKESQDYMPALDGLRGFAALLVVFSHITSVFAITMPVDSYRIGSFGVLLFFALSGFLMGRLYLDKDLNIDSGLKFAIARAARIAPAYYIAVIFIWILYLTVPAIPYDMNPMMLARSILFISNVGILWSIPPEVQFYAFFFLLWFSWQRILAGKYGIAILTALLCAAFIVTREHWGGLMLPSKLHIFLFGFLMAVFLRNGIFARLATHPAGQIIFSVVAVSYLVLFVTKETLYNDLVLAGLVALAVAGFSTSTLASRIFEIAPMRLIGNASFSIYLFHDPLLHLFKIYGLPLGFPLHVNIAIACILCLAPTIAFHFWAEKPLSDRAKKAATEILFPWKDKLFARFGARGA
jgi:peptidoglycan/LPS O-acetylase OafA/YrhL